MRFSSICLLVLLTACAYEKAMKQGSASEQAEDWAAATHSYKIAAAESPSSAEPREAIERVREKYTDQTLAEAQQAAEAAQFEEAIEKLALANTLDGDRPEVFVLTQQMRQALGRAVPGLIQANRHDDAYALLLRTQKLFPDHSVLGPSFVSLHKHYRTKAVELNERGRPADALQMLETMYRFEPDQRPIDTALRHSFTMKLAKGFADDAAGIVATGDPGGAALRWWRSFEVSGRQDAKDSAQDLLDAIRARGPLGIRVDLVGRDERTARLRSQIGARILSLPDVRIDVQNPELVIEVRPSFPECTEEVVRTPESTPWVDGLEDVANPDHQAAQAELTRAEEAIGLSRSRTEALWPILTEFSTRLQVFDGEIAELLTRQPSAQLDLQAAMAKAGEMQARLNANPNDMAAAQGLPQWQRAVGDRQAALAGIQARLDALEAERLPLQQQSNETESRVQALVEEGRLAYLAAETHRAALAQLPTTIPRPKESTLQWDREAWTRSCRAPLTLVAKTEWASQEKTQHDANPTEKTEDEAHIGHAGAALEANPKLFPMSDDELIAKADDLTLDDATAWLRKLVDEHYRVRTTTVAGGMGTDPKANTTEALRLLLGVRHRLEAPAVEFFTSRLVDTWELDAPTPLGGS